MKIVSHNALAQGRNVPHKSYPNQDSEKLGVNSLVDNSEDDELFEVDWEEGNLDQKPGNNVDKGNLFQEEDGKVWDYISPGST